MIFRASSRAELSIRKESKKKALNGDVKQEKGLNQALESNKKKEIKFLSPEIV